MTINERMTAAGIPGRPYTIAAQLDWAAAELDRMEQRFRIADLEAQLAAAQERNVALQSEHLDHVSALHKRIKELEKKNDHK